MWMTNDNPLKETRKAKHVRKEKATLVLRKNCPVNRQQTRIIRLIKFSSELAVVLNKETLWFDFGLPWFPKQTVKNRKRLFLPWQRATA